MRYKKEVFTNMALITQLGIHMLTPIFLCVAIGIFIDKKFDTSITLFLMIVGVLAGGRNTYILAVNASKKGKQKKSQYISQEYDSNRNGEEDE